ncbi:NAD-dependent epimerase/dehydratase family protein [Sulfuricystis thermophila]|uniref:NAD-dependent epimerase/dehydratase family protein n=1 Tax=Sulfuricystis thermophila TaxID=2496847 RepID=UPI0010366AE1|nr:NAD-dependent epimerase/dehydratase family protein [Sulfuricystis thermophila]
MTALITGANGFIGRQLIEPGDRALVRRPVGLASEVVGDLLDPASLVRACEGVETVFHCAGLADADARDVELLWRVNVEGTKNLLAAAGRAGVRRFVFFSSVKAMAEPGEECVNEDWPGEPATPYGRAKRAAEAAVLEAGARFGMHVVNLRLAMVYGRGSQGNLWKMAQAVRKGWFPPLPETGNRRSIVHVADVVAAARLVAQDARANGRTYIVADPRPYSSREIYDALCNALGLPPARWQVPAAAFRLAAALGGPAARISARLVGSACYSPVRIERELGFRAEVDLAAGLREMLG